MDRIMRSPRVIASAALGIAGATALVIASAGSASADTVATGGSTVISVPATTVAAAARAGIVAAPTKPATVKFNKTTKAFDTSFPVTGGDADVPTFTGTLEHGGKIVIANCKKRKFATISQLNLDLVTNVISGIVTGSKDPVALFDLAGDGSFSVDGPTQTYSATELDVDPAGAAALDAALKTTFFNGGQNIGSFTTTFTQSVTDAA